MARITETQLVQKAHTLIVNGQKPAAQTLISTVGYTPVALTTAGGYLDAVMGGEIETLAAKAAQTKATKTEKAARTAAQKEAIPGYQARSDQQKTDVETLRTWYTKASSLCKIAIKSADPTNSQQLLELLGLT